jgi:hypothetical protein
MRPQDLDEMVKNNTNIEPGHIFGIAQNRVIPVVKSLKTYIYSLKGPKEEISDILQKIFDPEINFKVDDIFEYEQKITTQFLDKNHRGISIRYMYAYEVLKLFGSKYFFNQLRLTEEEFHTCFGKFVDFCADVKQLRRLKVLFSLSIKGSKVKLEEIKKIFEDPKKSKGVSFINQILDKVGMKFSFDRTRVKSPETKKWNWVKYIVLNLKYPVLLNKYIDPAPIGYNSKKKDMLQLDENSIPILTSGSIPKMSAGWIEQYKNSVFFNMLEVNVKSSGEASSGEASSGDAKDGE